MDNEHADAAPSVEPEGVEVQAGAGSALRWLGWVFLALMTPFALHAGQSFFVPLLLSLFLSFTLSPLVDRLERWHVHRVFGATLAMIFVLALVGATVKFTINGATDALNEMPRAVQRLRAAITSWELHGEGPLKQMRRTADELQKLAGATSTTAATSPPSAAPAVPTAPAPTAPPAAGDSSSKALMAAGTLGAAVFVGQMVTVFFLTFFLLVAGDHFRRRLIQVHDPSLSVRKKTLQILRDVHEVSQRYFALMLVTNVIVGTITTIGLHLLGVRHPLFWGIAVAILHAIPYVGTAASAGAIGLVAYLQFESAGMALAAAGVPVGAALLIGIWLHTALLARAARMNAVVIFVALLFWGMVWGGWGLLLAFPIMATIKIVFGEIDRLKPLALLMSDGGEQG